MLYNIALVSMIYQHELAIGIHVPSLEIINTIIYILGKKRCFDISIIRNFEFYFDPFIHSITNVPGGSDGKEYTSMQETWI